jgi:hypothetical protein
MRGWILRLRTERCPDGVEIVHRDTEPGLLKSRYGISGSVWFSYRSVRLVREIRDVSSLEDTLVVRFVNATDDEKRIAFLSRFGLPSSSFGIGSVSGNKPTEPREFIVGEQKHLRHLLDRAGGGDVATAMKAANESLYAVSVQPSMMSDGRIVLLASAPMDFMHMEIAVVAASGARLGTCESCSDVFLTGPLTTRRSTARYCRDRCRVNAHRTKMK